MPTLAPSPPSCTVSNRENCSIGVEPDWSSCPFWLSGRCQLPLWGRGLVAFASCHRAHGVNSSTKGSLLNCCFSLSHPSIPQNLRVQSHCSPRPMLPPGVSSSGHQVALPCYQTDPAPLTRLVPSGHPQETHPGLTSQPTVCARPLPPPLRTMLACSHL